MIGLLNFGEREVAAAAAARRDAPIMTAAKAAVAFPYLPFLATW